MSQWKPLQGEHLQTEGQLASHWSVQRRHSGRLRFTLLGLALVVCIFPLLWTMLASFGITPDDTNTPPTWNWPPSFTNYLEIGVAEPGFLNELVVSTSISITAVLLTLVVALPAAYSLARQAASPARRLAQIFLILASLPVMAYIIPLIDGVRHVGLYDTFLGVALANTAIFAPLAVFVLFGYLRQIPVDQEESARLDGAGLWHVLSHVVLPQAGRGLAATGIILFVLNWNILLVPLTLTENHVRTLPVAMSDFFTFERDLEWPVAAAVLVTSLLPLLILVLTGHRTMERFRLFNPAEEEH